jgi:hypothetical protein
MSFDPSNCSLNIWKSLGSPPLKVETHLGMRGFIPSHSHTLKRVWTWFSSCTLALSFFHALCLCCKPKARIVTFLVVHNHIHLSFFIFSIKIKNSHKYVVPKCNAKLKFKPKLRWFKYMNIKYLNNYMARKFQFSSNTSTPPNNTFFAISYN